MAEKTEMKDLYQRLRAIGFDPDFLRAAVLPDWWDDTLASVPANRALAETAISRHLGFSVSSLHRPLARLEMPSFNNVRLKRNRNTQAEDVAPAMLVARHVADILSGYIRAIGPFAGPMTAKEVRRAILNRSSYVDLKSLVSFCWRHGIPVVHLAVLPRHTKKLDGMAMFCENRPVIVLAARRDSPPWLAFHLAHELAHVLLQHVKEGQPPWADADIAVSCVDNDAHENEADKFACELLTGDSDPKFRPEYGLTGPKLAKAATEFGKKNGISPGIVTVFYGSAADRWSAAQNALKELDINTGAHKIISKALWSHLNSADVPESSERFLTVLSRAA